MKSVSRVRVLVILAALAAVSACGSVSPVAPDQTSVPYSQTDLTVGTGAEAAVGTTASVQYALWLYSDSAVDHKGTQIDANSYVFLVGSGSAIKGFDQAVTGMKVGGTRRAIVPPSLAYGAAGSGPVPPNAALVFDIILVAVQ